MTPHQQIVYLSEGNSTIRIETFAEMQALLRKLHNG